MSRRYKHHWIAEHAWRALRSMMILIGMLIWLYTDLHYLVLLFGLLAAVVDQCHGIICRLIQKMLHLTITHRTYE